MPQMGKLRLEKPGCCQGPTESESWILVRHPCVTWALLCAVTPSLRSGVSSSLSEQDDCCRGFRNFLPLPAPLPPPIAHMAMTFGK